jgi:hypothetical protein
MNLVLGVTSNALFGLISHRSTTKEQREQLRDALRDHLRADVDLKLVIERGAAAVGRSALLRDEANQFQMRMFLQSPEVEALARQVFASSLIPDQERRVEDIKLEFRELFRLFLQDPEHGTTQVADALFSALVRSCEAELQIAAQHGAIGAQVALTTFQTRLLQGELSAIRKNLTFLVSSARPSIRDIEDFEEKYRAQVAERHGYIVPPNVDQAQKVPIDDLFVQPALEQLGKRADGRPIRLIELLGAMHRAVILGQPGGGKSTSAAKMCHDLATQYANRLCCGRSLTPIFVVLKDYGAEKRLHQQSIVQFIEKTAAARYQVEPPSGAFLYMLHNGRAMIVFDGLDELLDTRDRQEITADVESFCNAYPSVPVLVTSREVGYDQAPLKTRVFDAYRLSPFDESGIAEYVNKWFGADETLSQDVKKQKIEGFLRESRFAPDLRSNPLMLSLMCRIYRGENYIPQNRPDVYEKCATMLFEQWDRGRGIHVTGEVALIAAQIRPAIMYLALWIYEDETLQSGVTEQQLVAQVVNYLYPRRFADEDQAVAVAREFVGFLRGRAWVLSEAGTTSEGERLWSFTHRTFLEYFAAYQLVRLHPVPEDLANVLIPHILRGEWDVVAQLSMQIQQRTANDGGDRMLEVIVAQQAETKAQDRYPLVSFAVRSLAFAFPPPTLVQAMVTGALEWMRDVAESNQKHPKKSKSSAGFFDEGAFVLAVIAATALENRASVREAFEAFVHKALLGDDDFDANVALDLASHILWGARRGISAYGAPDHEYWNDTVAAWLLPHVERARALSKHSSWISEELLSRDLITWDEFLHDRGVRGIFYASSDFPALGPVHVFSRAAWSLIRALDSDAVGVDNLAEPFMRLLSNIGATLTVSPPPWVPRMSSINPYYLLDHPRELTDARWQRIEKLDADAIFAIVALFCAQVDVFETRPHIPDRFRQVDTSHFLGYLLLAHQDADAAKYAKEELSKIGLSVGQQELVDKWINGEVRFIGPKKARLRSSKQ